VCVAVSVELGVSTVSLRDSGRLLSVAAIGFPRPCAVAFGVDGLTTLIGTTAGGLTVLGLCQATRAKPLPDVGRVAAVSCIVGSAAPPGSACPGVCLASFTDGTVMLLPDAPEMVWGTAKVDPPKSMAALAASLRQVPAAHAGDPGKSFTDGFGSLPRLVLSGPSPSVASSVGAAPGREPLPSMLWRASALSVATSLVPCEGGLRRMVVAGFGDRTMTAWWVDA